MHPCMDVGGSERFQSHMTVRLESCMEPTRVGVGVRGRVVGLRWAGGWVGGGGSHLDDKKVFVWLFFLKKKKNRKSAHTHLLY